MKITEMGHLAFNCSDLDESLHYYRDVLGFEEKFCLYYDDLGQKVEGDNRWIVYVQVSERMFIELFNGREAKPAPAQEGETLGYQHLALVVEDIFAMRDELIGKNAPVDVEPRLGIEGTWQMWSHDPDGNKIEFMQYTDTSYQLVGRPKQD